MFKGSKSFSHLFALLNLGLRQSIVILLRNLDRERNLCVHARVNERARDLVL